MFLTIILITGSWQDETNLLLSQNLQHSRVWFKDTHSICCSELLRVLREGRLNGDTTVHIFNTIDIRMDTYYVNTRKADMIMGCVLLPLP